ncbi:MAG: glycosyltransferase family 2 protein [Bacteroidota bacterium]|nr:glycosyl transferase [Odoribacter sp.]MDP3643240.1 glycosyltransferase family 2 protein [Bacteroidota bacterium]
MKICGFTFVKNAVKLDFPLVESIMSALPLCEKFIVVLGDCEDGTQELIANIKSDKIEIINSVWDETQKSGGRVYALETDKAFQAVGPEFDWCLYLQADEILHEKDYPIITEAICKWHQHADVDGFLFKYHHFYGSYDYEGNSRKWYRNEIRIIRNNKSISSYRDAQGFRNNGKKLSVIPVDAAIFHYGWVRPPSIMQQKCDVVKKYYSGETTEIGVYEFDYEQNFDALTRFKGTHPEVMNRRIEAKNWQINIDPTKIRMKLKYKLLYYFEKYTGIRFFEYKNYLINPRFSLTKA